MKKLSAVIVVLAVLALALWLVLRDDRGPGDTVTTEPVDAGSETTDTTISDMDAATVEDGAAVAVSEDDAAVAEDDEMMAATDVSTVEDGTA
ncbi:MAG: hypothetical protein J4G15_12950, partial [Alphaproteobacteria bacterium]|nr:hypothetical protein [Alphaproteobacteria bacterium]